MRSQFRGLLITNTFKINFYNMLVDCLLQDSKKNWQIIRICPTNPSYWDLLYPLYPSLFQPQFLHFIAPTSCKMSSVLVLLPTGSKLWPQPTPATVPEVPQMLSLFPFPNTLYSAVTKYKSYEVLVLVLLMSEREP